MTWRDLTMEEAYDYLVEALEYPIGNRPRSCVAVVAQWIYHLKETCSHEWHADQDNNCNFCVKCGARQEIYTE